MNVLDLDLDLFLSSRKTAGDPARRPTDAECQPWTESEVRRFLECQCGLSTMRPTRGAVFEEHHEAFNYLRDQIAAGAVAAPFELVHADAHADLGMRKGAPAFVMAELLHQPPLERRFPPTDRPDGLSPASWLLFAIACRWIASLAYVHHPDLRPGELGDIPRALMVDNRFDRPALQLKRLPHEAFVSQRRLETFAPLGLEPIVPLQHHCVTTYRAAVQFDLVLLARSPGYTPPAADSLMPVIREYISEAIA